MTKIDTNRLLLVFALIALVVIAALTNYRLEISTSGLKFEKNPEQSDRSSELFMEPQE